MTQMGGSENVRGALGWEQPSRRRDLAKKCAYLSSAPPELCPSILRSSSSRWARLAPGGGGLMVFYLFAPELLRAFEGQVHRLAPNKLCIGSWAAEEFWVSIELHIIGRMLSRHHCWEGFIWSIHVSPYMLLDQIRVWVNLSYWQHVL